MSGFALGGDHDYHAALHLASYMCGGSCEETSAYIEWLRQRTLNHLGRLKAKVAQ
jgi:hypothetical protein